jgi:hypothetical protein
LGRVPRIDASVDKIGLIRLLRRLRSAIRKYDGETNYER